MLSDRTSHRPLPRTGRALAQPTATIDAPAPRSAGIHILASGPIVIGQTAGFDHWLPRLS